jgi:3D (Asp-Asp-Asp) domain-containing protein
MLSSLSGSMVNPKESKIVEPNPSATIFAKSNELEKLSPPFVRLALVKPEVKQEVKSEVSSADEEKTVQTQEAPKPKPLSVTPQKKEAKGNKRTFVVTAYTANVESTGKRKGSATYGQTASGKMVQANHTVSCPKSLPFETKLYIPSLNNTYTCEDRGGAIVEGHLDIYIPELQDAQDFGRQKLEVIIIPKGSEM